MKTIVDQYIQCIYNIIICLIVINEDLQSANHSLALKRDSVKIMIEIVDSVIRNHANRTLNII